MSTMNEYAATQLGRIADSLERIVVHFETNAQRVDELVKTTLEGLVRTEEVPEYEQMEGAYSRLSDTVLEALGRGLDVDGILRDMIDTTLPLPGKEEHFTASVATKPSDYEAAVQALADMPDDIPPEPVAERVEKADVIAALNKFAAVHGIAKGKEVLNTFAPRLDDVPPERYADVIRALEVLK